MITTPVTSTLKATAARMDGTTGLPINPNGGDAPVVSVWKNGSALTGGGTHYTATVGSFVANVGNLLTVTLTSALAANDNVVVKLDLDYPVEGTLSWFEQWVCTNSATETNATANKAEILTALAATNVTVNSPASADGTLTIYNTRTYGGSAHSAISFTVAKNYSSATSVVLVIHEKGDVDTEYQTLTATVASATSITVSGTISVDADYQSCQSVANLAYSLFASWSGSLETITSGDAYVYDQPV